MTPRVRSGGYGPSGAEAGRIKSASALNSPDRQMFSREKKAVFLLFSWGYLTPRD
ncbi:hypothetical protein ACQCVP_16075 [Rossellomorea vietnamensis]